MSESRDKRISVRDYDLIGEGASENHERIHKRLLGFEETSARFFLARLHDIPP